jgi:hypothetical protein
MIQAAVRQIALELNQFLKRSFARSEEMVVVSNILEQDGTVAAHIENKVVVFLTNIEKETVARALPQVKIGAGARSVVGTVPLHLNLYVMFAAYFSGSNYPEALKSISATIRFFQMTPVLDHHNTPDLDPSIDMLALEIENLDIQQLSNLWGILSSRYLPSIMYKVRMVTIDAGAVQSEVYAIQEPRPSLGV